MLVVTSTNDRIVLECDDGRVIIVTAWPEQDRTHAVKVKVGIDADEGVRISRGILWAKANPGKRPVVRPPACPVG